MKDKNRKDLADILYGANKAKDALDRVVQELEEAGYRRKANSCMSLILKIEEWQNKN